MAQQVFGQKSFKELLEFATAPGSGRLFAMERAGTIWSFDPKAEDSQKDLLVDLKALYPDLTYAYGLAFHPKWRQNHEVFVCITLAQGVAEGTKVYRFHLDAQEPPRIDPKSAELLMTWVSGGHNGANLQFGPDGFLYISTGDAEAPAPPDARNTGQDNSDLLSAILRIDIDHRDEGLAYAVPKDNPYVNKLNVRPEVWAFGFRNPWKMSFDDQGRLWCGDVGWELWEMIHLIQRGGNYGWSAMEASQPIKPETASPLAPITPPVVAHPHTEAASITGGYVYRGQQLPELRGAYIYGDYETGKIWALWHDGKKLTRHEEIADTAEKIVTFGQTEDGEIVYAHYGTPTTVHRLVRNPASTQPSKFPRLLSKTGLFTDTVKLAPQEGVFEFNVAERLWQKGMAEKRHIALPGETTVQTVIKRNKEGAITNSTVTWPKDSVLARTVSVAGTPPKPVETQVLHFNGETWNGYSYRWNAEGTDAQLVGPNGEDTTTANGPYRFHSRAECMRCHTPWGGHVLGFQPQQLTTIGTSAAAPAAVAAGLVDASFFESSTARLAASSDSRIDIDLRARSWLHANCAHCHRDHGGGSVAIKLNIEKKLEEMKLVGEKPLRGEFGIADARIVAPGVPWRSVLVARIARSGSGHMPLIGCQEVDGESLKLLWDWIEDLGKRTPALGQSHPLSAASQMEDRSKDGQELSALKMNEEQIKGHLRDPATALSTVHWLNTGKLETPVRAAIVKAALSSSDPNITALFEAMDPNRSHTPRLGLTPDAKTVLAKKGQAANGRELLSPTGKLAACFACHFVQGIGRDFGPDLSTVGARLSREQLLESLLQPSKTIAPGFAAYVLELTDGGVQSGFMVKQDASEMVLKLPTGQALAVTRKQMKSLKPVPASLMPEGLVQSLTLQEAADLLAYLESLK
jgi:putative heme-binding domain-containing protein